MIEQRARAKLKIGSSQCRAELSNLVRCSDPRSRIYVFRRFCIRDTNCQSSALTPLFEPGQRLSPIRGAKRSHFTLSELCARSSPLPGQLHFQDFFSRSRFSKQALLAVQSQHTIFSCLFDCMYFRRVSYGNLRCPRSPHSSHRYAAISFGDMPLP